MVVSIRLPSLAYNTKRRFAYVQFSKAVIFTIVSRKINQALGWCASRSCHGWCETERNQHPHCQYIGPAQEENSWLASVSSFAVYLSLTMSAEGRELYIVNIPFEAKEDDLRTLLSHVRVKLSVSRTWLLQYGDVVGLTLLSRRDGGHSGRAFVIFRTKVIIRANPSDWC